MTINSVIEIAVESIQSSARYRKDYGDIAGLAASIEQLGLLQPIGVNAANELVFGQRRLKAFQQLGRSTIPARVIDVPAIVLAEHAENEIRKDFTVSERVEIGKAVEAELGKRQGQRTDLASEGQSELVEILPQVEQHNSGQKTREIAAQKAGFGSDKTYRDAKTVVEKAAPELVEAMDSGKVAISTAAKLATAPVAVQRQAVADPKKAVDLAKAASAAKSKEIQQVAKEIRAEKTKENTQAREQLKAAVAQIQPPAGKYRCIVIDPPWDMQKIERDVRPNQVGFDYPTMSEAELKAFDVPGMAHDDSHLFLWATHKHLPMAFRLMDAWGFKYIFTMVWHKPGGFQPIGLAQYNCEFVLFGRRGGLEFLDTKAFPACFQAPRREHSRKPDEFFDLVRRVSPGPRIDVFSRESRDGFDQYGNEIGKFDEVAA